MRIQQVIHGHFAGETTATLRGNITATLRENPIGKYRYNPVVGSPEQWKTSEHRALVSLTLKGLRASRSNSFRPPSAEEKEFGLRPSQLLSFTECHKALQGREAPVHSKVTEKETRPARRVVIDDVSTFWTVQQFTAICGQPWYALQRQNDEGVQWGITGYRHEIDAFMHKHRIKAEELPPITEAEYFQRCSDAEPTTPSAPKAAAWNPPGLIH